MLVATRDPSPHSGTPATPPASAVPASTSGPGVTKLMNLLQIVGSVLAIPVGLASGYSIYHANFSVEARCQSLRSNIVSMLDKSADAATLRMLVHRDVLAFEQSCGSVDPDAVAAFKTLLAAGRPAAPVAVAHSTPEKERAKEAKAATKVKSASTAREPHQQAALSDARWLSAVRGALVSHHTEHESVEPPEVARLLPAPVAVAPVVQPARVAQPAPTFRAAVAPAPVPVVSAPQAGSDHPIPPGLIPDAPP